jgi:hypothetical protein
MRILYYLSLCFVLGALAFGYFANDARDKRDRALRSIDATRGQLRQLQQETAAMQELDPWPLRFGPDALAEFFTRTVEAGEVLGAGVRIQARDNYSGVLHFSEHRQGVQMCPVTLQAGLAADGAAAVLAMFEEELADLPVAVRKITARTMSDTFVITMDVDVFGR